jgi:arylsulfatase A-like enzyme/Flp pilus assembly protein TadD
MRRPAWRLVGALLILVAAAALGRTLHGTAAPAAPAPRDNILLVTIDTLRSDRVGAYGGHLPPTPTLDRLATEGCLFEQAVAQAPMTRPSHASILTGLYPFQHGIRDNFAPPLAATHRTIAEILKASGYVTGGFVGSFIVNTQSGLGRGFDEFDDSFGSDAKGTAFFSDYQRRAGDVEARAGAWIERVSAAGKPFFAWVHFYDPHSPYTPPPPYSTRYANHPYEGEIAYTDAVLGHLIARLQRRGIEDRTLVVVTADHGESLGEHGEDEHGFFVYDAVVHVPLLMRYPARIGRGVRVKAESRSVDLLPTILDLARVTAVPGLPGRSLVPDITGVRHDQVPAYSESLFPRLHFGWSELRSIRMGGWKYVQAPRPELYDLTRDPGERNNLYAAEGPRAAALRSRLLDTMGGSMETAVVADGTAKLDPATLQRLASLGYVSGPGTAGFTGADPKDTIAEFQSYGKSVRAALEAYDRGDVRTAARNLKAIVAAGRGGFDVSFYLGKACMRLNDYQGAVTALQEAVNKLPTYTPSYIELAKAHVALKQYDAAMAALQEGLKRDPANFQFHSHLGYIARIRRDLPTARQHYETARTLEPGDFDVRMNLSSIYRDMGEPRLALREVDAALLLQPESSDAHNQRGMLLGGLGDNTSAAAAFERASSLSPKDPIIWFNLGLARLRSGNRATAGAAFRKALELKPDFEEARKMAAEAGR